MRRELFGPWPTALPRELLELGADDCSPDELELYRAEQGIPRRRRGQRSNAGREPRDATHERKAP